MERDICERIWIAVEGKAGTAGERGLFYLADTLSLSPRAHVATLIPTKPQDLQVGWRTRAAHMCRTVGLLRVEFISHATNFLVLPTVHLVLQRRPSGELLDV